eukprot:100244_1
MDAGEIQIELTLKQPSNQKLNCMIQCTDDDNQTRSQRFTVHSEQSCVANHVDVKPNTEYKFAMFLNDKQISNEVSAQTPADDFDPNHGYSPSPPVMASIRKY